MLQKNKKRQVAAKLNSQEFSSLVPCVLLHRDRVATCIWGRAFRNTCDVYSALKWH